MWVSWSGGVREVEGENSRFFGVWRRGSGFESFWPTCGVGLAAFKEAWGMCDFQFYRCLKLLSEKLSAILCMSAFEREL